MRREAEERLYLGPAGAKLAAERRRAEERKADDDDLAPAGPVVVLDRLDDRWFVFFDPPLADGEQRAAYRTKNDAWAEARQRAADHRLGFRDDANPQTGNRNAARM